MLLIDTYLDKSKIQGVGVFSKENITKGKKIKEVRPEFEIRFDKTNLPRMPLALANFIQTHAHEENENEYCLGIDNEKYLNHSDNPTVNDEGYALKDIKIGDEITIDYRDFDDNIETWLI
jgi:SET domain-containing protein